MRGLSLGLRLSSKRDCDPDHAGDHIEISDGNKTPIVSRRFPSPMKSRFFSSSSSPSPPQQSQSRESSPCSSTMMSGLQDQLATTQQELDLHRKVMKDIESVGIEIESMLLDLHLTTGATSTTWISSNSSSSDATATTEEPLIWRRQDIHDENDSGHCTSIILNNLKNLVSHKMKPIQERIINVENSNKDLRLQMIQLEKQHRHTTSKLKQDIRKATDDKWLKENEIKRLQQQVEALESEISEAQQLAEAHDSILNSSCSNMNGVIFGKNYSSDESNGGDASSRQSISKVREKFRKKRESENRFLERFQGARSSSARDVAQLQQSTNEHRDECPKREVTKNETAFDGYNLSYQDLPTIDIISNLKTAPEKSILKPCSTPQHQNYEIIPSEQSETPSQHQCRDDDTSMEPTSLSSSRVRLCDKSDQNKRVSFGTVHIRFHLRTLGDHPAVTFGPPISLDWKYKEMSSPIDVDEYENNIASSRPEKKNTKDKLFMSSMIRRNLLLDEYGFSEYDIDHAIHLVDTVKNQRAQSYSDSSPTTSSASSSLLLLNPLSLYQHYPTARHIAITT